MRNWGLGRLVRSPPPAEAVSQLTTGCGHALAIRPHVILELQTDDGQVGYGEASPLPRFAGETVESIKLWLETQFVPARIFTPQAVPPALLGARSQACAYSAQHDDRGIAHCRHFLHDIE